MNLKSLILATLLSTTAQSEPLMAFELDPILRSSDFTHAEKISRHGSSVLRLNLTQTGINKLEILKQVEARKKVTFEVNGKFFAFKVRDALEDQIEVGPFSHKEATKIAEALEAKNIDVSSSFGQS